MLTSANIKNIFGHNITFVKGFFPCCLFQNYFFGTDKKEIKKKKYWPWHPHNKQPEDSVAQHGGQGLWNLYLSFSHFQLNSLTLQPIKLHTTDILGMGGHCDSASTFHHQVNVQVTFLVSQSLFLLVYCSTGTSNTSQSTRLAAHRVWDNGWSQKHCDNQGQWNFPCIIKKGLVRSVCKWEVPLVNPTKVFWLQTWRAWRGLQESAFNPPDPLYRCTLNPLTTSRFNLRRFGWVNKFLISEVHDFPRHPSAGLLRPAPSLATEFWL